jgi:hypothetical protein
MAVFGLTNVCPRHINSSELHKLLSFVSIKLSKKLKDSISLIEKMKTFKIILTTICLVLTGIIVPQAQANNVSISDIDFSIHNSFHVQHPRTKKQMVIKPKKGRVVKIIGQNDWAFVVQIYDKGVPHKGKYLVAKKWARRALNMQAAIQVAKMNKIVKEATNAPVTECNVESVQPIHNPIDDDGDDDEVMASTTPVQEDELLDEEDKVEVTVDTAGFKAGCEVLTKAKGIAAEDRTKLLQCVNSIRKVVSENARNANGTLNRNLAFKNLYSKLKPEEQRFASMIFTAQGEAAAIVTGTPPSIQEYQSVMKVVENRKNNANQRAGHEKYNELDMALQPAQFSMYNSNDNGWKNVLDPGVKINFNNSVNAFISYENAVFAPKPQVDQVYHYHTNYVNPDWKQSGKAMRMTVDGKVTRNSPAGFDENTAAGRNEIKRKFSRIRHIFYHNIAWNNKPQKNQWRN